MLKWKPLHIEGFSIEQSDRVLSKLRTELKSWEHTKFVRGLCMKDLGVDCDHFVCSVLDHMYGISQAKTIPRARHDAAIHSTTGTADIQAVLRSMYPWHIELLRSEALEPGDVATTGPENGDIGHIVIAGPDPNTFWHAQGKGVRMSGRDVLTRLYDQQMGAFHFTDKHRWL